MTLSSLKHYHHLILSFTVILLLSNIAEIKIYGFFGYSLEAGTIIYLLLVYMRPYIYVVIEQFKPATVEIL